MLSASALPQVQKFFAFRCSLSMNKGEMNCSSCTHLIERFHAGVWVCAVLVHMCVHVYMCIRVPSLHIPGCAVGSVHAPLCASVRHTQKSPFSTNPPIYSAVCCLDACMLSAFPARPPTRRSSPSSVQ